MGGAGVTKRTTGEPAWRVSGAKVPKVSYLLLSRFLMLTKASNPCQRADSPVFTAQYAGRGRWVLASSPRKNCELTYAAPTERLAHGHGCQARPKLSRCFGTIGRMLPAGTVSVPGGTGVARSTRSWNVASVNP